MSDRPEVESDAFERLKCRDEVLQVLFWLAGEGFDRDMTIEGIARFVARPAHEVGRALQDAIEAGLVAQSDDERYEATPTGRREGGRRFTEEFAEMFARDSHGGTCTDPFCDCHDSPEAAGACRPFRPLDFRVAAAMQAAADEIEVPVCWGGCWDSLMAIASPEDSVADPTRPGGAPTRSASSDRRWTPRLCSRGGNGGRPPAEPRNGHIGEFRVSHTRRADGWTRPPGTTSAIPARSPWQRPKSRKAGRHRWPAPM